MRKIKILFLAANPTHTERLALGDEAREIIAKIRASEHRDSLELITRWATTPDDLLQALNEHRPHIVHFSGHGTGSTLTFTGPGGEPKPVSTEALAKTFRVLADNIRVVVLNACYSRAQAEALARHIDCVVGMTNAMVDGAAANAFAAWFYGAIGFGCSVKNAFDQGCAALGMEWRLESVRPELLVRDGVDADSIRLLDISTPSPPSVPSGPSASAPPPIVLPPSTPPSAGVAAAATAQDGAFDVFLSHNSTDKLMVREIGLALRARGLRVWLDEWELVPGMPWQEATEEIIQTVRSAAVLVAKDGLGPWEVPEMRACLREFVHRKLPVIPVLLPGAPTTPSLPLFLQQFTWVDLRSGITTPGGLYRLEWGITGRKPASGP